jgi:hypothetical protein
MKKLVIIAAVAFGIWKFGVPDSPVKLSVPDAPKSACKCKGCCCKECKCTGDGKCKCKGCWGKGTGAVVPTVAGDVVNGPEHDGRQISTDLPTSQHLRNKGGSDGAGLCVFTSIDHAARWQNVPELIGFRDFMTKYPGGGYPQKVDQFIPKKAGGKEVDYVQFTDSDPAPLYLALRTGRMPCITYGYSPRYGGNIAHMVNLVYLDDKWACILDNNFPATYEWVESKEFLRRWKMGGGGWSLVLLSPGAPPIPRN